MASNFTAQNPKVIDGTAELITFPVATAQTWKRGAPLKITAGELTLCADTEIASHIAADDQTTPTQGTYVPCYRLQAKKTRLEVYVTNAGTAAAIGVANVGVAYDMHFGTVDTTIAYLDVGATADACWRVLDLAANYEPERNATADTPGKCIVLVEKVL